MIRVILAQPQMPSDTRHCRDRPELVNDVARQEVNVIVIQRNPRVLDAFAFELIELGVFDPLDALRDGRLMEIELKFTGEEWERLRRESDDVFRYAILRARLAAMYRFENTLKGRNEKN